MSWAEHREESKLIQSTSAINLDSSQSSSRLLDQVIRCMVMGCQDHSLGTPASFDHYHDEFLHLTSMDRFDHESPIYRYFFSLLHANKHLCMRGTTFGDLVRMNSVKTSQSPIDLSEAVDGLTSRSFDTAVPQKIASRLLDTVSPQIMRKRLAVTKNRHVGMAPSRARKGDVVCLLLGYSVPVVLRNRGTDFEFLGECYLEGYMDGELIEQHHVEDFILV